MLVSSPQDSRIASIGAIGVSGCRVRRTRFFGGTGSRQYGYDIVKKLRAIDGLVISEGTVYPILSRLKRRKLVTSFIEESNEGPARKYYVLTDRGQNMLSQMNASWSVVKRGIDSVGD